MSQIKYLRKVFLIIIGFIIYSCGENEEATCLNCMNNNFIADIKNLHVTVLSHSNEGTVFLENKNKPMKSVIKIF